MDIKLSTTSDLGVLAKPFGDILAQYKLTEKEQDIFNIVKSGLTGALSGPEVAAELGAFLKLDFSTTTKLGFELQTKILDHRLEVPYLAEEAQGVFWDRYNPANLADDFADEIGLDLSDSQLSKRFATALTSFFLNERSVEEIKAVMLRSSKVGGMGLPEEIFKKLLTLMEAKKKEIEVAKVDLSKLIELHANDKIAEEEAEPESEVEDEEIDVIGKVAKPVEAMDKITGEEKTLADLREAIKTQPDTLVKKIEAREELLAKREELSAPKPTSSLRPTVQPAAPAMRPSQPAKAPSVPAVAARPAVASAPLAPPHPVVPAAQPVRQQVVQPAKPAIAVQPPAPQPKQFVRPVGPPQPSPLPQPKPIEDKQPMFKPNQAGQRPMMQDVKFMAQLYGPLDELASFSIDDFRRLAKDPEEAVEKLRGKLELLEDESIIQKTEGIKALKSSPLYKLYAEIMNQAMMQGKSIEEVSKTVNVSLAEFKAIMELNKSLKY